MESQMLLKDFSQYVILNICGMIGLSCYILADTFFVSNGLGANGLTALNLAIPIYSFVHGSGLMFGMGGATKYSIYRGQKEYKNADKAFSNTIYIMSSLAVIFMLTGILREHGKIITADARIKKKACEIPHAIGSGYTARAAHQSCHFLDLFNRERRRRKRLHRNGHQLHGIIVRRNPVGAHLAALAAAMNDRPLAVFSDPDRHRLHVAAAVRSPVARLHVHM